MQVYPTIPRWNAPITHVLVTHAHWDHIGGLPVLRGPSTQVVAQARFADELRVVNETGVPFRYFVGKAARRLPTRAFGAS